MKIHIGGGIDHLTLVNEQEKTLCVFEDCDEETRQLAAHIVKCVNEREGLVAALSAFDKWHEQLSARDWENGAIKDEWRVMKKRARAILEKVRS